MTQFWLRAAIAAAAAYFLGCFNGAVIISKYILHDDVRAHGSGNAGLTNFLRTFGGPLTAVVLLLDVVKTVLAVLLSMALLRACLAPAFAREDLMILARYWAGVFVLLGHSFPCMFHFRGGKGVLAGGTVALMVDWRVAAVVWGGFLILTVLTRYVSLGSCFAGAAFPVVSYLVYGSVPILLTSAVMGLTLLWGHRGNVKRLIEGTERKLSFHKKKHDDTQGEEKP